MSSLSTRRAFPTLTSNAAACILKMQQELAQYIKEKCTLIVKNSEYAYDVVLENLRQDIDREMHEKKQAGSDLAAEISKLNAELASIKNTLQALQEVQ